MSGSSIAIASGLEWIKLSRVMDSVGMPTLMDRPVEGKSKGRKKRSERTSAIIKKTNELLSTSLHRR